MTRKTLRSSWALAASAAGQLAIDREAVAIRLNQASSQAAAVAKPAEIRPSKPVKPRSAGPS